MSDTREPEEEAVARIRAEMRRHRAACGCEVGSVFTLIALVVLLAYLLSGHGDDWTTPGTVARGVCWVIAMSVVGKCLGLGHARLRLVQLGRQLDSHRPRTLTPPPLSRTE